jgi:hypothetical protein
MEQLRVPKYLIAQKTEKSATEIESGDTARHLASSLKERSGRHDSNSPRLCANHQEWPTPMS